MLRNHPVTGCTAPEIQLFGLLFVAMLFAGTAAGGALLVSTIALRTGVIPRWLALAG